MKREAVPVIGSQTRAIKRLGRAALVRVLQLCRNNPELRLEDCEEDVGRAALRVLCPTTCTAACTFAVVAAHQGPTGPKVMLGCNLGQVPVWRGHCPMHTGEE